MFLSSTARFFMIVDRIGQVVPQTETAGFPLWLIAVLLAVVLLIALVSLIIFLVRRQKTGTYLGAPIARHICTPIWSHIARMLANRQLPISSISN